MAEQYQALAATAATWGAPADLKAKFAVNMAKVERPPARGDALGVHALLAEGRKALPAVMGQLPGM